MKARTLRKLLAGVGGMALLLTAAACSGSTAPSATTPGGQPSAGPTTDEAYAGTLTFWFWAEPDVPGATAWMEEAITRYEQLHPDISIELVPQASETLQGAFETAGQSRSGPDIAMQWATLPVLTPVWRGYVEPLTGLVPEAEMANWLNTAENTYDGKVWAMPLYLLGAPFVWNKDLFAQAGLPTDQGPQTWDELLAASEKLKAAGITPIVFGAKDGAFGGWFQGMVGTQTLDSVQELQAVYSGKAQFTEPKYSRYLELLAELVEKGYLNSDISSIDALEGWQQFAQGQAAMTWATDGNVVEWMNSGLGSSLGVQKTPTAGDGALAQAYTATQSISAFVTSWSEQKVQAATFLTWLHDPENLVSWYETTGSFPADKRFDSSLVEDGLKRDLYELNTLPLQLWAQNYAPPQVDSQGLRSVGQALIAGSLTPDEAAAEIQRVIEAWQTQQPAEFEAYLTWAEG